MAWNTSRKLTRPPIRSKLLSETGFPKFTFSIKTYTHVAHNIRVLFEDLWVFNYRIYAIHDGGESRQNALSSTKGWSCNIVIILKNWFCEPWHDKTYAIVKHVLELPCLLFGHCRWAWLKFLEQKLLVFVVCLRYQPESIRLKNLQSPCALQKLVIELFH